MAKKPTRTTYVKGYVGSRYASQKAGNSSQALQRQFANNMKEILGSLQEFIDEVRDICPEVLVDALEPTLGKAIEYCPEDTGTLRASAFLESEMLANRATAIIGFGDKGQPDYAIYVHEMPYKHAEPTRSKFLQSALDEDYYQIIGAIPKLIRERMGT